ncbi:DUF2569 family protein [Lentisphaerota bacterium WC36G]|nr:DUF2569 domain-containing protein [Lentisphaerae bacterium WC36]
MKVECQNCKAILEYANDYRENRADCSECGASNDYLHISFGPTIKFECFNCSKALIVPESLAGSDTSCTACGINNLVPKFSSSKFVEQSFQKNIMKDKTHGIEGALIVPFVGLVLMAVASAVMVFVGISHSFNAQEVNLMTVFAYLPYCFLIFLTLSSFNGQKKSAVWLTVLCYLFEIKLMLISAIAALGKVGINFIGIAIVSVAILWKVGWVVYFFFSKRVRKTFIK